METTEKSDSRESTVKVTENLTRDQVIEIWKYFAETGGANKERMVTIATWLLFLSAAVIGIVATRYIEFSQSFQEKEAEWVVIGILAIMGIFLSTIGILIILICAGYANRNWDKADELAEKYGLEALKRDKSGDKPEEKNLKSKKILKFANFLSTPKNPKTSLAYVFWIFLLLAAISLYVHLLLLIGAIGMSCG